jgi:NitT/TauT family transport system substrate-binding protein
MRVLFSVLACAALVWSGALRPVAADDDVTTLGTTPASFYQVLEHVAVQAGFYKEEHLNVNKQYAQSASTCAQLVATGKADICTMSVEPIILGYAKNLKLQFIFSHDPRYTYVLGVPADSPIRTLADFKGADIGEINIGSTSEISANDMLNGAGLKKSDYAFIPIGAGVQALAALDSHKVAGASFPGVELGQMALIGHEKFRIFRDPILDDIPNMGFGTSPATVQNRPDVLKRFLRAIVMSAILVRVNPQLAAQYFFADLGQKPTPEQLQTEVAILTTLRGDLAAADPTSDQIGRVPVRGIALYCTFFQNSGQTPQLVPAAAIATNQFIAAANDFDHKAFIERVKRMR